MGARTVDALQCFTFLTDNVPAWITRATDLASHSAAKHAEFSADYVKLSAAEKNPPRRRKNSSLNTNRDDDDDEEEEARRKRPHSSLAEQQQSEAEVAFEDPLTLLRLSRDRKKASKGSKSSVQPRHKVVVQYDSYTQNALEVLIRDVGGARNNIRKGRMNQMMKKGFGFKVTMSSNAINDTARPIFRSSRMNYSKGGQEPGGPPFDSVDKLLETVQSLCETGAHHFLRFGDCSTELNKTKENLALVLETARGEVTRLQAEPEAEETGEEEVTTKDISKERQQETIQLKVDADTDKHPSGMGVIEVDDGSDASSMSLDMAAFRSRRLRT